MPWVQPRASAFDLSPAPVPEPPTPDLATPGLVQTVGAALRLNNTVASSLTSLAPTAYDADPIDEGFNPFDAAKGTKYEAYPDRLATFFNRKSYDMFTSQIDREEQDGRTIAAAGWGGVLAATVAGIADLPSLVPAAALARNATIGYSVGRSALAAAGAGALGAGAQEAGLQATQEKRTARESAVSIGGGAILGGMLGAAGAKLLSNAEWNRLAAQLERDAAKSGPLPSDVMESEMKGVLGEPGSAGAAAVSHDTLDDLSVAGRAASATARATARLNPLLRALHSPSARSREILLGMMENPVYLKKNLDGSATAPAVETLMKEATQGWLVRALDEQSAAYKDLRRSGGTMPKDVFKDRVGQAMRTNDIDAGGDEFVTRAAQSWRRTLFDPLKERGIEAGVLDKDVSVNTAPSYFHRMYNRSIIEGNEQEFKSVVRQWATETAQLQADKMRASAERQVSRVDQEVKEINYTPEERKYNLALIEGQLKSPNTPAADISSLQRARARIRFNISGSQDEIARLNQRVVQAHEDNIGRLDRMATSVGKLRDTIETLDPEKQAKAIADLHSQFNEMMAGSNKAQDRVAKFLDRSDSQGLDIGDRLLREEAAEARRSDVMNRIAARIDDLESADPEGAIAELQALIRKRSEETLGLIERAHEKVIRGRERIEALNPDALKARVAQLEAKKQSIGQRLADAGIGGDDPLSKMEAQGYIEDIVSSVFNKITGRQDPADGESPFRIVATTRGPLKERTFDIEDAKVERFLESDIELVGRRYTRVMAADTELARKYGRADMRDQIQEIQNDYAKLREGVTDPKELKRLNKREKDDITDLRAVRDMLRGQYLPEQNASGWARVTKAAMTFNYLRSMGGVVLSSLTDVARPMMVHGLSAFMADGVKPLVTNLKGIRMSVAEARLAGTISERTMNTRLATMAELTDPYAHGSPFERFLDNVSTGFSKATGMPLWNDWMKGFASVMTQNRILRGVSDYGALAAKEKSYLAFLGIDEGMAGRIARQLEQHGDDIDGVKVAGTNDWTDDVARRTYRAALNKDVDSVIVTKGVGDVPLFAKTPTGRALLQFKGFALASHQRVLIRGLQEDKARLLNGTIASATIGAFIAYLKSVESNKVERMTDNPGQWIAEGLDRSGLFALFFEVNNTAEKIGLPGAYWASQKAFPNSSQRATASRYASRSVVDSYLGPTVGLAKDAVDLLSSGVKTARAGATGGDYHLSPSDIDTMRRLLPGASLPVIRSLVEYGAVPWGKSKVEQ